MDLESILHPLVTQPLMVTPRHASAVDEQEEDFDEQTGDRVRLCMSILSVTQTSGSNRR